MPGAVVAFERLKKRNVARASKKALKEATELNPLAKKIETINVMRPRPTKSKHSERTKPEGR